MNYLLSPVIAECSFGCGWNQACSDFDEAATKQATHEHLRHGQVMPPRELAGSGWQEQAVDAVRTVAARGVDFTVFEALREFGVGDPPNAKTALGRFGTLIHDMHIAHPVSYRPSLRQGTKRSAAAVWNRDQARCTDPKCRAKVGAA